MLLPSRSPRARKRLGQHFLIDGRVADRSLDHARIQPSDRVLEIGPGTGSLTRRLAARCAHVVAVEADRRLLAGLVRAGVPAGNVDWVHGDATKIDFATLPPFNKVVANLPYSVSTPITFRILPLRVELSVLMYQREFATRLVADVEDAAYGRLSAARAYWAEAEYLETVPASAFRPRPRVSSAIVRLTPHGNAPFAAASAESYERLLRVLFSARRKTIRASLRRRFADLGLDTAASADQVARDWGMADERPERVPPPEFGRLTLILAEANRHA